jgi:cell wall-associated NlpC family hydrolase
MAAYRYRYRRSRYGRGDSRGLLTAVAVVAVLAATSGARAAGRHAPAGGAAYRVIAYARQQAGCPYVYGGTGPCAAGFDCSGLVQAAYAHAGVTIPRTSEQQWAALPHVSAARLAPGDLIFYTGSPVDPPPGHVTMYLGDGQMIEAYATGYPVRVVPVRPGATGAARPQGGAR